MASFLLAEAEKLHVIGEKTPALAIAFEDKIIASSRKYIESLCRLKLEQLVMEKLKEYDKNPVFPFVDLLLPIALRGYDIEHPQKEGDHSREDYLKSRNLYVESTLPNAQQIVDYLDYLDLLEYLRFFTHNKIDSAVEYGRRLASDSNRKHKTRMDGTPLPIFPPIFKVRRLPRVKVNLPNDTDAKEDSDEKNKSKKPSNIF